MPDFYSPNAGSDGWRPQPAPAPGLPAAWQPTGFTALPAGWLNSYTDSAGATRTEPCPGVLLQACTRNGNGDRKGATRTVYAANGATGTLIPAADHPEYTHTQLESPP